ncbi:MAG: hypothetical protein NTV52_04410 [Acidobacteria bacterium]|nr:hypothetical protein [Acidobacteriota bacterium]
MVDGRIRVNYVNNYLKPGPNTKAKQGITLGPQANAETRFHLSGNHPVKLMDHPIESQPFPAPAVLTQSAAEGYSAVLARAGARRDPVDPSALARS